LLREGQSFGQASGFVELDVDHVIARAQSFEPGAVMYALVSADGHNVGDLCEDSVTARGKRLLDQEHATLSTSFQISFEIGFSPSLVGIGDEACIGRGGAHRCEPCRVAFAGELDFEKRAGRRVRCSLGHFLGRANGDGEGRYDRLGLWYPGKDMDWGAACL